MDMDENNDAEGIEQLLATPALPMLWKATGLSSFSITSRSRSPCPKLARPKRSFTAI